MAETQVMGSPEGAEPVPPAPPAAPTRRLARLFAHLFGADTTWGWVQILGVAGLSAVLAAVAIKVHPFAPFALVVGLGTAIIGLLNPFAMLLLFLVVLFTRPGDFIPALAPLQLAKLTAASAVGVAILGRLLRRDISWVRAPQNAWLLMLTLAVFLSTLSSSVPEHSMASFKDAFIKLVIIYFLIVNVVDTPRRAVQLAWTLALANGFLGAYALYAKVTGIADIEGSRAGFVGLLGDPNDLALTLLMSIPFVLAGRGVTRGGQRVLLGVLAALLIGGLLATQSRGGMLGFAAGTYFLTRHRIRSRAVSIALVATALLGLVTVAGIKSRETVTGGIDESAQGRLDAWYAGYRMARARPLLGVGFETFAANYLTFVVNAVDWRPKEAHNSFIKALAETGLAGFIPFCMLMLLTWRGASKLDREHRTRSLYGVVRSTQLAAFGGVLTSAFFLSQTWTWFLYILAAVIVALNRLPSADEADERSVSSAANRAAREAIRTDRSAPLDPVRG